MMWKLLICWTGQKRHKQMENLDLISTRHRPSQIMKTITAATANFTPSTTTTKNYYKHQPMHPHHPAQQLPHSQSNRTAHSARHCPTRPSTKNTKSPYQHPPLHPNLHHKVSPLQSRMTILPRRGTVGCRFRVQRHLTTNGGGGRSRSASRERRMSIA